VRSTFTRYANGLLGAGAVLFVATGHRNNSLRRLTTILASPATQLDGANIILRNDSAVSAIHLNHEHCRVFKKIKYALCTSKFVSDVASHTVRSRRRGFPVWQNHRHFGGLGPVTRVSDALMVGT
jgi:hypothetical protein